MAPALHRLGPRGTLPARSTAIIPGYGLIAAGFVNTDQCLRSTRLHRLAEGGPLPLHLGTLLFYGVKRFFAREPELRQDAALRSNADGTLILF
jgi:hypothetical protein